MKESMPHVLSEAERAAMLAEAQRAQACLELVVQAKRVRRAEKQLQAVRDEQTKWLRIGARAGLSLAELAAASGVSRQAVQQRVKPLVESPG